MRSETIKSYIIDDLLKNKNVTLIASEVPFANGRRKADLVFIEDGVLNAIEIKGPLDNLEKIEGQISDYKLSFERVWVLYASNFKSRIREKTPLAVGLIEFTNNKEIKFVRCAKSKKQLDKSFLSSLLGKDDLRSLAESAKASNAALNLNETREIIAKTVKTEKLLVSAKLTLENKYKTAFDRFINKIRGDVTHPEDVQFLTIQAPQNLNLGLSPLF